MTASETRPQADTPGNEEHALVDFISKMNRRPIEQLRAKAIGIRNAPLIRGYMAEKQLWLHVPKEHEGAFQRILEEEGIAFQRTLRVSPGTPRAFSIPESHHVQDLFHRLRHYFKEIHPEAHIHDHPE
ncbi:MAG TPA: hypothetical protein VJI13_06200 [Candidatus Norongarragalinales archaeon]|nr:hypothetical protein [Candidatus Norongarragalinales archaeon]